MAISLRTETVDDATTTAEKHRLSEMCRPTKQGYECALVGPVAIVVGTRRGEMKVVAEPTERATIGVRGATVYCRPG